MSGPVLVHRSRSVWWGPVHVSLNRRSRDIPYCHPDGRPVSRFRFRVGWFSEVDKPHGDGTGKALRIDTAFGYLRVQFGGSSRPWARQTSG